MNILRLVAGGLLALICCYIGILIKRRYKERETAYRSAADYARMLKFELSAKKTPIPDIATAFCKGRSGEFESALLKCVDSMSKGGGIGDAELKCLKPADSKELLGYIGSFGGSALDEQIALADRLADFAAHKAAECEKDTKRLGNMYFRLLVLLGLAIILILA